MNYRCSVCGRRLLRQYAQKEGRSYGPICAAALGIKPYDPYQRPEKQKATKHLRTLKVQAQWGQLELAFA